jgi:hypothetical protein
VRTLALLSVLIALASVTFVTATALGQDEVSHTPTPDFAEGVPRLLPMNQPKPTASATPVSSGGIDQLAALAAAYWLLLAGVALRRSRRSYSVSTAA